MSEGMLKNAIPIWSSLPATDQPQFTYKQSVKNVDVRELRDILGELIEEFGIIKDLYEENGDRSVILFEDKPYNWSARLNIGEMLALLLELRIPGILLTDGAQGYINTTMLSTFPVPEIKKETADYLLKLLKISPTEYCHALYSRVVRQEYRKQMKEGEDEVKFMEKLERSLIDSQEIRTIPICGIDQWGYYNKAKQIWKSYPEIASSELPILQDSEKKRAIFMADEILRRMQQVNTYTASLACCGNTPELICSQLKNLGVSYLVLSPKTTEQDVMDIYMKEIRGELSPLEKLLAEGMDNKKKPSGNRLQKALGAFEQAIHLDPINALAYTNKGFALSDLKRYQEALDVFEQAIHLNPNSAPAYTNKGIVLRNLGREQEALDVFEQAIHLDPTNALAYTNKGIVLRNLERYQEALDVFEQAIHLNPNSAPAYIGKGNALNGLKRYQKALGAFEQAIHLDPTNALAYTNKGIVLRKLERYQEALAACEQAIHLDLTYAPTYTNKGIVLRNLGREQEALNAFEQAIHLDPNSADAYIGKGNALSGLKRYQEALDACEQAIHLDPTNACAYTNKGGILGNLKRYQEALAACEQAIHLDPTYAPAYTNKSITLERLGKNNEAQRADKKARQLG